MGYLTWLLRGNMKVIWNLLIRYDQLLAHYHILHLPPFGEKINSKLECPKNTSSTPTKSMFYSKSSNWRDQNKKPAWE